jgi:NAD+ diphosphatase
MLTGLREAAALLHVDDANLLAATSGLATWHAKHRFCGSCGVATDVHTAGHERRCPSCGALNFPRTDPAVIMLVTDGDRAVLGRQKIWPAGMFSTLAGFVEPGESLEDAVVREVREEVGLVCDSVRYSSSQPWPFPQSLMVGFHAEAVTTDIVVHPTEMDDAQWFSRDQLNTARSARGRTVPMIPPPLTIARRLLDEWLDT